MGRKIKVSKWDNTKQNLTEKKKIMLILLCVFIVIMLLQIWLLCTPVLKHVKYRYTTDEKVEIAIEFSDYTYKKTSKYQNEVHVVTGVYYVSDGKIIIDNEEYERNSVFSIQIKVNHGIFGQYTETYKFNCAIAIIMQVILGLVVFIELLWVISIVGDLSNIEKL